MSVNDGSRALNNVGGGVLDGAVWTIPGRGARSSANAAPLPGLCTAGGLASEPAKAAMVGRLWFILSVFCSVYRCYLSYSRVSICLTT